MHDSEIRSGAPNPNITCSVRDEYLGRPTLIRNVEHHDELDSTNSHALRLIKIEPLELGSRVPLLILADRQTAGRGRDGRTWWTGPGSIAMSLVVKLEVVPVPGVGQLDLRCARSQLGLSAAVALAMAIVEVEPHQLASGSAAPAERFFVITGEERKDDKPATTDGALSRPPFSVGIKWPNDVYINGKKVAGILVELAEPDWAVIGLGVNTNCLFREAPPEVQLRATSLRELTGVVWDNRDLVATWLEKLGKLWAEMTIRPGAAAELANRWCVGIGEEFRVRSGNQVITGVCRGIAPDGALLIEEPQGGIVKVFSGHVL
ncbi:MAG: biotin--[acetyl-CoA-carboxylase] ligase [Thermoguttaceae bacterium]|nr:biotin--[acetyl-CoA-carboxylase] ligase [Thermoguttaceae bacterium]MDW8077602.1 biotin--[acetyl-CoA-carboxylase] ligase [Thermoguttaceae bacterium]